MPVQIDFEPEQSEAIDFEPDLPEGGLSADTIAQLNRDARLTEGGRQMNAGNDAMLSSVVNSFVPKPPTPQELREQELQKISGVEPIPLGLRLASGLDTGIRQGLATPGRLVHGAADLAMGAVGAGNTRLGRWNADMLRQYADYENRMQAQDVQTFGGNDIANQLASGTGRAVTELPLYIAPGMGAANAEAAVARAAAAGGVVGGGTQYAQDRGEGRDRLDAATYATASGLITAMTTRAFGATGAEAVFRKEGVQGIRNRIVAVLKDAGLEGAEEAADQVQQDFLERYSRNPEKPVDATLKEVLMAGAIGGLVGGGVGAATEGTSAAAESIADFRDNRSFDQASTAAAREQARLNSLPIAFEPDAPSGSAGPKIDFEPETLSQSQTPVAPQNSDTGFDAGNEQTPAAVPATSPVPGASSQQDQVRAELESLPGAQEDLTEGQKEASQNLASTGVTKTVTAPEDVPATKADLKALADFIENGGPNPFAAKVEPKPANAESNEPNIQANSAQSAPGNGQEVAQTQVLPQTPQGNAARGIKKQMPAGAAATTEVTAGAPIPTSGQEAVTVTPSRKPAKAKGTRAMKVFTNEETLGGPDILTFIINEAGGMVSKSSAKRRRGSEWWKLNASLYDDAAPLARPHHNVIYSDNGTYPDQIAQAAYDARVIKEPSVNALWQAIKASSAKRGNAYKLQRQQEEHLETQAKFASATAQGDLQVTTEDLQPGDTFEVDGEPFTVKRVDQRTGDVTLDDGKVFGRQVLEAGQQIWVEKPSDGLTERVAPDQDDNVPFAAGESKRERMVSAAIRDDKTGKISTGATHGLAARKGINPAGKTKNIGFITDRGRFVTSAEAEKITGGAAGSEEMAFFLRDADIFAEEVENLMLDGLTRKQATDQLNQELFKREKLEAEGKSIGALEELRRQNGLSDTQFSAGDDFFGAPESVDEQKARQKREAETLKLKSAKETMQERAGARLTGQDIDTTQEMFSTPEGRSTRQDKSGQGSLFRGEGRGARGDKGTARERVQNVVAGLQREMPKALPTTVVNSPEELPAVARGAAAKQGVRLAGVKGTVIGGRVYLVASNLASPAEAQSIWLHEQVGHFATDAQLGKELRGFMAQVHDSFQGSNLLGEVRSRYPKADKTTLGREVVARLAEDGATNPGALKRLLALFRAWLRKLGLVRAISENDLRVMLQRAAESLRGEDGGLRVADGQAEFAAGEAKRKQIGTKQEKNAANYIRNFLWEKGELEAEYHDALHNLPPKEWQYADIESSLFRLGEKRTWQELVEQEGDTPHKFTPKNATPFVWAKQNHGTTSDINEAGYVLPDGDMLDFSERRHGGGGERSLDHRNIQFDGRPSDGYEAMRAFIALGGIRVDKSGAVDIGKEPTGAQMARLRELGEIAGSLTVDLLDGNRKASFSTENVDRGIGMIRRFYRGEELPEHQTLFAAGAAEQSEFAKLQEDITAAETELMTAIRQHINPPAGMRKAEALEAKNDAHRKLRDLLRQQLKMMTDIRNLDAARSPEETANLISQTVDLLNSIQDDISERTAKSEAIGPDLLKLRTDLQERLSMLKNWSDDQSEGEGRGARGDRGETGRARFLALESATDPQHKTFGEWWQTIKNGLRYLTSPIPELPLTGERAEKSALFRRGYRLFAVENNRVRKEAAERVNQVLEPLTRLGRTPASNEALRRYYQLGEARERAAMDEPKRKAIADQMLKLEESTLNKDPFNLFRRLVLYKDLRWRGTYLKNDAGKPITLPMGLTVDEVASELRRTYKLIENHPDGLAITEALRRHYKLTDDLQKSILEHGEIIPESLRNPLYFPHHVIDSWSGNIARVRPSTEEDFRKYLIAPTGSAKLIQTDYLKAMYLHTADVLAHNARVDLVDKYWKPYDISEQLKAQHGDKWNLPWNIPPGYKLFTPFNKLPLRMDYVLSREVLADKLGVLFNDGDLRERMGDTGKVLKVKPEDLRAAMVAGEKIQWVLPAEIADALNGIAKREAAAANPGLGHAIGLPFRAVNNFWKKTKLFAPWNWIRYEYGNLSTDAIDKVLAADPGAGKYLSRAAREIWTADTGEQSAEYKAAQREGVFDTITAGEAGELTKLPEFKAFLTGNEAKWEKVRSFLERPMRGSKFREATFRYAKFLADVERLRAGKEPTYAGAFHGDIEALGEDVDGQRRMLEGDELIYAKAAEISLKTYGDYNSLGVAGQWLRQYAVPFWSWQDVNFRYHANQLRNIADGLLGKTGPELNTARKAALRYAGVRVVSTLLAIGIAKELWNQFGGPMLGLWDDDDDLESKLSEADRRRGHLIVGKDKDGKVLVVYTPSAWSDVAEWMGGQNMKRLFMEYVRGQITLDQFVKDYAKQMPRDVLNKLGQSLGPLGKAPYETISGKSTFPDVLDQRNIPEADKWWRLVGTLTDDRAANVLRAAFDQDYYSQPATEQLQQIILQIRRRDPEQWAYYEAREDAADWKEARTGKRFEQGSYDAPEAQALRNFRKAIYRGDVASAERFYDRLLKYGYTSERLDASIRNQAPLSDLNESERAEYVKTLTPKQRQELDLATKYYNRLKALDGREKQLFPKKGQKPSPKPELLKRIVEKN